MYLPGYKSDFQRELVHVCYFQNIAMGGKIQCECEWEAFDATAALPISSSTDFCYGNLTINSKHINFYIPSTTTDAVYLITIINSLLGPLEFTIMKAYCMYSIQLCIIPRCSDNAIHNTSENDVYTCTVYNFKKSVYVHV